MMGLAEALAEPTGARVDLLAFLFAHADEIGLGPGPGPCTREMYGALFLVVLTCFSLSMIHHECDSCRHRICCGSLPFILNVVLQLLKIERVSLNSHLSQTCIPTARSPARKTQRCVC